MPVVSSEVHSCGCEHQHTRALDVDATIITEGVKLTQAYGPRVTHCKGQAAAASGCKGCRCYALRALEADFVTKPGSTGCASAVDHSNQFRSTPVSLLAKA